MKVKKCEASGFSIQEDEDIDLSYGVVSYDNVEFCPITGEKLVESEVEEED